MIVLAFGEAAFSNNTSLMARGDWTWVSVQGLDYANCHYGMGGFYIHSSPLP